MLIDYVRNKEQFKSLAKTIKSFRTADLYKEFNDLGNYINTSLKTEFEKILNISLKIEPDKFLINVGNGSINWVGIVDIVDDNSIPLNKLQQIPNNSVLCTDEFGNVIAVTCTVDYGILFGRYQNTHIWRKLLNEDIEDYSITGDKIDKLSQLNIDDSLTNNFLSADILETKHFEDNIIISDKIIDGSLDSTLFNEPANNPTTPFIPAKYENDVGVDNLLAFNPKFLQPSKIMDNTIYPIYNPQLFSLREYSDNQVYLFKNLDVGYEFPEDQTLNVAEILESFNIAPECLEDDHLIPYQDIGNWQNIPWYDDYNEPRYFQQGYITPNDTCRVEGRCIPLGQLRLRHFDDEVRQALIAKGVTDND
jgi:hypothetical protein